MYLLLKHEQYDRENFPFVAEIALKLAVPLKLQLACFLLLVLAVDFGVSTTTLTESSNTLSDTWVSSS
jgi:hypothetical protein